MPLPLASTALALAVGLGPLVPAVASSPTSAGWRWPLAGTPVVARPFLPPTTAWGPGHRGVDLAAAPDAAVLSAGAGVVSFAGYVAGVGVVAVTHAGGLRTTYEPVAPAVHVGRQVRPGDLLGRLLPGHGDCGPGRWCLHWGLLRGSVYLDPLTLIRRGPVRLLPLPAQLAAVAPGLEQGVVRSVGPGPGVPGATGPTEPSPTTATRRRAGPVLRAAGAATGTAAAGVSAGRWWVRKRRMAARSGRHRRVSGAVRLAPGRVSRAGRRAWP